MRQKIKGGRITLRWISDALVRGKLTKGAQKI
jgi:hypothetical protein